MDTNELVPGVEDNSLRCALPDFWPTAGVLQVYDDLYLVRRDSQNYGLSGRALHLSSVDQLRAENC